MAYPEFEIIVQSHFKDERLDDHLRQHDVEFLNDVPDGNDVRLGCENQQRIGALVRDDFGVPEDNNISCSGGSIDDLLQSTCERRTTCGAPFRDRPSTRPVVPCGL